MAIIIDNCEFWWAKLVTASNKFDATKPRWEIEIRTTDKTVSAKWKEQNLKVKVNVNEDDSSIYWFVRLQRSAFKRDGTAVTPPIVVGGDLLPIDNPNTIGNGSKGRLKIRQWESKAHPGTFNAEFEKLQVTSLHVYVPRDDADFEVAEMEVIQPVEASALLEDDEAAF
jgi:hypothetical protein